MYLLLRRLGFTKIISFILGLSYGYTTFLMPRMGHLNYTAIYVFPFFYYFSLSLFREKEFIKSIFWSIGTAGVFALSLYLNIYYFVILFLSVVLIGVYYLFFSRKLVIDTIKKNLSKLIFVIIFVLLFISPWLKIINQVRLFEDFPETSGWGGAIQFSSDLFGIFIPSIYSYFLNPIAGFIGSNFSFAANIFENYAYPGLIILLSYLTLIYLWFNKKLNLKLKEILKPLLFVSLSFWILTLGPFLHVFGKWGLLLDEGIRIVVPLPYAFFHYLPFMSNIRVPGRLVIGFIFFSYIVVAYIIKLILNNRSKIFITYFFIVLSVIIVIDQYFVISSPPSRFIPNKVYSYIQEDKNKFSVLEIPSTVRDGFVYFGGLNSLEFIEGQDLHNKPVIGGYLGRIPYYKRAYYQRNPFIGYIYRLIDPAIEQNGGLDKSDLTEWQNIDLERSKNAIDFLSLKYIVLNENEKYSAPLEATLEDLGFNKIMDDKNFTLLKRIPENKEFLNVDIGGLDDDMYLGQGWGVREKGFRWSGKKSSVIFKINQPRDLILQYKASSFYKPNEVTIYINKNKIDTFIINTDFKEFKKPINKKYFLKGINFVYFMFDTSYKPKEVIDSSLDERDLSAKFTEIYLLEMNK